MEMLFFRAWTVELMPDPVRTMLGIPTRRPPQPAMAPEFSAR